MDEFLRTKVLPSQILAEEQQKDNDDDYDYADEGVQRLPAFPIRAFTFVRDPVSRFVTAVRTCKALSRCDFCRKCGQETVFDQARNKTVSVWSKNTTLLMDCLLDTIEHQQITYLDRHLAPQVYTLLYSLQRYPITIDLLPKQTISAVLECLRGDNQHAAPVSISNENPGGLVNGFDFSSTAVLNQAQIRRICQLYEVDVRPIQHTGLDTTPWTNYNLIGGPYEPWFPNLTLAKMNFSKVIQGQVRVWYKLGPNVCCGVMFESKLAALLVLGSAA